MLDLGDYAEDATLDFFFTTRTAAGAPATFGGTPALSCYKGNGTTETTTGVTLTVDFDARTGLNQVRIDTSADAFYATGNDYAVVVTTGTVDGTSVVGEVLARFSIEKRWNEANVTHVNGVAAGTTDGTATAGGAATITLATGVTYATNALRGRVITIVGGAGAGQSEVILSNTNATPSVVTVARNWLTAPDNTSTYAIDQAAESPDVAAIKSDTAAILLDTGTDGVVVAAGSKTGYSLSGTTTTLDALQTALNTAHGAGSWATATSVTVSDKTGFSLASTGLDLVTLPANIITATSIAADAITAAKIAAGAIDAATFAADVDAEILSYLVDDATRIDASALNTATATTIPAIAADLPQRITKNTALSGFPFFMVLSSDHVTGATGKTVTATRSLDGAAFAACANAVTEVSNGWYKIDLAAADLNGNTIALKFTATDCDARMITIITQPT